MTARPRAPHRKSATMLHRQALWAPRTFPRETGDRSRSGAEFRPFRLTAIIADRRSSHPRRRAPRSSGARRRGASELLGRVARLGGVGRLGASECLGGGGPPASVGWGSRPAVNGDFSGSGWRFHWMTMITTPSATAPIAPQTFVRRPRMTKLGSRRMDSQTMRPAPYHMRATGKRRPDWKMM